MTNDVYIPLENRAVLAIKGGDANSFLQGLITNDINKVTKHKAIYALMLTPQGKFLYDFFICMVDGVYMIDCSNNLLPQIKKKLSMYKLRSDISIEDVSDRFEVVALIGEKVFEAVEHKKAGDVKKFCKGAAYIDPRSEQIYARAIIERENQYQSFKAYDFAQGRLEDYEEARINAGIPSGDFDMQTDKSFPLDFAMDKLNAIDFEKGCYVGQEVTARVHHRGKIRKGIYLIKPKDGGSFPDPGADIMANEEKAGVLLSSTKSGALSLIKHEVVEKENYTYKVNDMEIKILSSSE